jgi:phosphoribosyl 1,2-cyclic phosphodiesterase
MKLAFCSFSSGSSGNCYLIKTEETAILIDAGIPASRILSGLYRTDTDPEDVKALFVTHEHSDHVSGLNAIAGKLPAMQVYTSAGTWGKLRTRINGDHRECVEAGTEIRIGNIEVRPFSLSHDAVEPLGYCLRCDGKQISIVTDTGVFTDEILSATADSDILVIESNHDVEMLMNGRYPPMLKQRILGMYGHLSNTAAGEAVLDIMALDRKPRCIFLAHLSRDNNRPQLAEQTVSEILGEMDYWSGRDLYLKPLLRDRLSPLYEV